MSNVPVQKGETLKVGFGSFAYVGYVPEDGLTWAKPAGNKVPVTDENGATLTKIIMDPRDVFTMTLIIKDTGGSITPPIEGATVEITDPAGNALSCMNDDASVAFAREHSRLTMTLIKEASMTYT